MSKGLEALRTLISHRKFGGIEAQREREERRKIIEQELKELEEYRDADIKVCAGSLLTCTEDFTILWNEHKALEIIKEKSVDVHLFVKSIDRGMYNLVFEGWNRPEEYQLTQEEYGLLKEVLE